MGLAAAGEGQGDGPGGAWEGASWAGDISRPGRRARTLQGQKAGEVPSAWKAEIKVTRGPGDAIAWGPKK